MTLLLISLTSGMTVGVLLSLLGAGGSILTVPILVYGIGQTVHQATGTSLVIIGFIALGGAISHYKKQNLSLETALLMAGPGIAGATIGAWLNMLAPGRLILLLFASVMFGSALKMLSKVNGSTPSKVVDLQNGNHHLRFYVKASSAGLGLGALTGFLGIGGGFLIVPTLTEIIGLPMHLAVGTSLAIIVLNSLAGIANHVVAGNINWSVATLFILAGYFGTLVGSQTMRGISEKNLKKMFAGFVLMVATFILTKNLL